MKIRESIVILYVALVLGFTTISLWDVKEIISDYVFNNRLTVVRKINGSAGEFPFVDDLRVCLLYGENFPFFFPNVTVTTSTLLSFLLDAWNGTDELQTLHQNLSQASQQYVRDYLVWFSAVSIDAMDRGLNTTRFQKKYETIVNAILTHPAWLRKFKSAWTNITPAFIKLYKLSIVPSEITQAAAISNLDNIIPDFTNVDETSNNLCVLLPLANQSTAEEANYLLDLGPALSSAEKDQLKISQATALWVSVNSLTNADSKRIYTGSIQPALSLEISISNTGCFDITHFPPCTKSFSNAKDCLSRLHQETVEEMCSCRQISAVIKQHFRKNTTEENYFDVPYCTPDIYSQCWARANPESQRRQADALSRGACTPCLSAKNDYRVSTTSVTPRNNSQTIRIIVRKDQVYILYEDRPQFTLAQLISQIGGELGLYIGFSMLSLLQFALFLYHMHQQRRDSSIPETPRSSANVSGWFQYFVRYSIGQLHDMDKKKLREQHDMIEKLKKELADFKYEMREALEKQGGGTRRAVVNFSHRKIHSISAVRKMEVEV